MNCITDDRTACNSNTMKSAYLCFFNDLPLFLFFFNNIHEYANYANKK